MKSTDFAIETIGGRTICLSGVGRLFYQDGYPLSMTAQFLQERSIEISWLHLVEELWENGWSWKTIEAKLQGEIEDDFERSLALNLTELHQFYICLEQPYRQQGGYEKSRAMIFQFMFGCSIQQVRDGESIMPLQWAHKRLLEQNSQLGPRQ